MPYIGQPPVSGDTTKSFRLLDNLASFTLSFDATSSSVVDTTANTLTFANHRFVTAQRVTYSDGGGTAIGGLTDGTAYFIIKVDQNTIQLASSASNANNGTAISLSSGAVGSHTLNLAFDGTNTKFKATYANGTKAKISRAGQLLISINGVLQQAQESSTPTLGFGLDSDSTIVFSQAPVSTDVLFGQILADTITNFDTQDNTLDVFTGDGSTVNFNLSKKPASNNDILVTLDGVVQYPTTTSTSNAYSVTESTLTFTAAPADGVAIQVRHIGFAGATSSAVTGLYGRTGNVTLSSSDDDITVGNVTAGIITATSYGSISGTTASFSGNVSIGGTLTYEDVTNIDAVGLITARSGVKFGASGTTVFGDSNGIGIGTENPAVNLQVKGSASNGQIYLGGTGAHSQIYADNDGVLILNADQGNSAANSYLGFNVDNSERLRIDSSGRLQIGASNNTGTNTKLVVGAGNNINTTAIINTGDVDVNALTLSNWDGSTTTNKLMIHFDSSGIGAFNIGMPAATDAFVIDDGGTERLRIDSSGNMGLGTNSPTTGNSGGRFIHIHNTGTDTNRPSEIVFTNGVTGTTGGSGGTITYYQDDLYTWNYEAQNLIFGTNATERMRVDSSGRLMLGTTTEGYVSADDLTVATSGSTGITIRSGTGSLGTIAYSDGTSGADEYRGYLQYDHSGDALKIGTNGSERLRIDSAGRVFFNETSSDLGHKYILSGNESADVAAFQYNSNSGTYLAIKTEAANGVVELKADARSGNFPALVFKTGNNERTRIDKDGRFLHGITSPSSSTVNFEVAASVGPDPAFKFNQTVTSGISYDFFLSKTGYAPDNNSSRFLTCSDTGATRLIIQSDGDVINHDNSYGAISDVSLKQQIVDASSQWDDIKAVRVRKFKMNSDVEAYGDEAGFRIGVVAQELEQTSPGLVKNGAELDGTTVKTVNYSVLYMKAVKALQESQTRIETLESQHADLLARVTALEG